MADRAPAWQVPALLGAAVATGVSLAWWKQKRLASSAVDPSITTASAPGKVMVTGGYLVLDPAFSGLVLSLSARFHSTISRLQLAEYNALRARLDPNHPDLAFDLPSPSKDVVLVRQLPVVLHAPQRSERPTLYWLAVAVTVDSSAAVDATVLKAEHIRCVRILRIVKGTAHSEDNKYVEYSLLYPLSLLCLLVPPADLWSKLQYGLALRLRGDYQFYSSVPPDAKVQICDSAQPSKFT